MVLWVILSPPGTELIKVLSKTVPFLVLTRTSHILILWITPSIKFLRILYRFLDEVYGLKIFPLWPSEIIATELGKAPP